MYKIYQLIDQVYDNQTTLVKDTTTRARLSSAETLSYMKFEALL